MNHSDFVIYVDESGDHSLDPINPEYPLFVLAFCIFKKSEYAAFLPQLHELKFRYFGHDSIVFHERDIRKATGPFSFLVNADKRNEFLSSINDLVAAAPFTLIASVIQKEVLRKRYTNPYNPYELALLFGLERAQQFLIDHNQEGALTHVIVEQRGKKEDRDLELEFRRIRDGTRTPRPFELVFVDKRANCCGLQLADLCARPVGRHLLDSKQENRAFSVLESKFYRHKTGQKDGFGLKCFP